MSEKFDNPTDKSLPDIIKDHSILLTFLIFCVGALKILIIGEHYKVALYNFISFSNLLVYTFDILRGLVEYAFVALVVFLSWRGKLANFSQSPWGFALAIALLILCVVSFIIAYYHRKMDCPTNMHTKWVLELGFFCLGVILAKIVKDERRIEIIRYALLGGFLYLFVKVDFKFDVFDNNYRKQLKYSEILLKPHNNKDSLLLIDGNRYVFFNTAEFIFIFNDVDSSVTTIPMSSIAYFTTNSKDTAKIKSNKLPPSPCKCPLF